MKDSKASVSMIIGRWYKIRHRAPRDQYDRMSVMEYAGIDNGRSPITHRFVARPLGGIKMLPHSEIKSVEEVPANTTPIVGARWKLARSTRDVGLGKRAAKTTKKATKGAPKATQAARRKK